MNQLSAETAGKLKSYLGKEIRPGALIGFDGYVDKLVRLKRSQHGCEDFYPTITSFAEFVQSMGAMSADIALHRISEKIGGNGPLLADALARKTVPTVCIGAMGEPELDVNYQMLKKTVNLISVADVAHSLVMEFDDGKLMFGDTECFANLNWAMIRDKIGIERLRELFSDAALVGFANWSGLPCAGDLLHGILKEIGPSLIGTKRHLFFDLADPSAKSEEQFQDLFQTMKALRAFFHVTLGLNPKECLQIYNRFFDCVQERFTPQMVFALTEQFPADEIVVHIAGEAIVGSAGDTPVSVEGIAVERPVISVGAGDNFNSGYCLGLLADMNPKQCAYLGNLAAYWFVSRGTAATGTDLLALLNLNLKN